MRWRINSFFRKLKLRVFPPKPLLSPKEHQELLLKSRQIEALTEQVCKQLKCKPDEMLDRIIKVQKNIADLEVQIASYNQPKPEDPLQK